MDLRPRLLRLEHDNEDLEIVEMVMREEAAVVKTEEVQHQSAPLVLARQRSPYASVGNGKLTMRLEADGAPASPKSTPAARSQTPDENTFAFTPELPRTPPRTPSRAATPAAISPAAQLAAERMMSLELAFEGEAAFPQTFGGVTVSEFTSMFNIFVRKFGGVDQQASADLSHKTRKDLERGYKAMIKFVEIYHRFASAHEEEWRQALKYHAREDFYEYITKIQNVNRYLGHLHRAQVRTQQRFPLQVVDDINDGIRGIRL